MEAPEVLSRRLRDGVLLRPAAPGVWSALPEDLARHPEDPGPPWWPGRGAWQRRVARHDAERDRDLLARALESPDGALLALGPRSLELVAQAGPDAAASRPMVLLDRSLARLAAAHRRLTAAGRALPGTLALVQAEVLELPFRAASFTAVLACDELHRYPDPGELAAEVADVLAPDGELLASGLAGGGAARWLHRLAGTDVRSRLDVDGLRRRLEAELGRAVRFRRFGSRVHAHTAGRREAAR